MIYKTRTSHSRVSVVYAVFSLLLFASCKRDRSMDQQREGRDHASESWTNAEEIIDGASALPNAYSACVIRFQNGKYVFLRFLKATRQQALVECGTLIMSEDAYLVVADRTTNVVKFAFDHGAPMLVCGSHSIRWFAPNTVFFSPDMAEAALVPEHLIRQDILMTNMINWTRVDVPPM